MMHGGANPTVCEETVPNRFRFNGQQYDPVSQQYYLRARYYNPVIGRFTQEDTYRGDGLNLYAYCRNNPVYYVDPSGHAVISCEKAQEHMRNAIAADQRIQDIDTRTANQLRKWYQFKSDHDLLTPEERRLAGQIGLDVDGGSRRRTLFHYTSETGMNGIVDSQRLNPSLKVNNPKDCFYGEGQYLSDIVPGTKTPAQLSRTFINNPFQGNKYSHYVEIDVTGLDVTFGRDNVFVILNQEPLDLTGRIVSFGKVGE